MRQFFLFLFCQVFVSWMPAQNVAINTTGAAPNASALLDIDATSKGLLVPRVSTNQRTLPGAPGGLLNGAGQLPQAAEGLLVYDHTQDRFFYNISTTVVPQWVSMVPSNAVSPCRVMTVRGVSNDDTFDMTDTTFYVMDQMVQAFTPQNSQVHVQFQTLLYAPQPFMNGCGGTCNGDVIFAVAVNNLIQPNTLRVYPRGFFNYTSNYLYEINFTVPVTVTPGVSNTIDIRWAINKPYDAVCCPYTYNSIQLQQFTSNGEAGYLYVHEGWSLPVGYRTMTLYDCP